MKYDHCQKCHGIVIEGKCKNCQTPYKPKETKKDTNKKIPQLGKQVANQVKVIGKVTTKR